MLNLALLSVREETAKVMRTQEARERYVLIIARACCSGVPATPELKLGQYNQRNTVPVKHDSSQYIIQPITQ